MAQQGAPVPMHLVEETVGVAPEVGAVWLLR
jgi:hypothetical protein